MLVIGEPTPRPEVPIEGPEMIIPLICIGIFFLVILGLFARYFCFMHSERRKDMDKQDAMYRSPRLKREANRSRNGLPSFFPKTYGGNAWASWRGEFPNIPERFRGIKTSEIPDDEP